MQVRGVPETRKELYCRACTVKEENANILLAVLIRGLCGVQGGQEIMKINLVWHNYIESI